MIMIYLNILRTHKKYDRELLEHIPHFAETRIYIFLNLYFKLEKAAKEMSQRWPGMSYPLVMVDNPAQGTPSKQLRGAVLQISNTGTDVPVVTKIAADVDEAVGDDDVLLLDPGGPPTLVLYAVQLHNKLQN